MASASPTTCSFCPCHAFAQDKREAVLNQGKAKPAHGTIPWVSGNDFERICSAISIDAQNKRLSWANRTSPLRVLSLCSGTLACVINLILVSVAAMMNSVVAPALGLG